MSKKINKTSLTYGGIKIHLTKSKTQAAVQYNPKLKQRTGARRGGVAGPPDEILNGFEIISSKRGLDSKLDKLRQEPEVSVGTHVWNVEGEDDTPFVPTGILYLAFFADADIEKQQEIMNDLSLNILEEVGPGAYRVSTTPASPNPVKCALQLQKNKLVMVAEPEFAVPPAERGFRQPTGHYINTQWHLENTGQSIPIIDVRNSVFGSAHFKAGADAKVKAAWQQLQSLGSSEIRIAVIDTGFSLEHPQLQGDGRKVRNPLNAASRSTDVNPFIRHSNGSWGVVSHGTSCAAVAVGALDGNGIVGAAPNARLIPIKLDTLTDTAIKNAFEHAMLNGADIISCSLGYPKPVPLSTYVHNYISQVARNGRGGRGIPIFIAAGNANAQSNYQTRAVSDFAAHPSVICVTASNSLDQRASYSFYGANAHICAPTNGDQGAGITTATIELSPNGQSMALTYTSSFGGTSSAAPLAAGVCALMLTANPDLSAAEVKDILRMTADKIGSSNAYDGNGHSIYYGFGRLNALRAVIMAASKKQQSGSGSGGSTTVVNPPNNPVSPPAASGRKGRVVSNFLNVRSGPSTSYARVGRLNKGDVVDLLQAIGNWWRIGPSQFVSGDYIQEMSAVAQGKVISSFLNVRTGPSTAYTQVGRLNWGQIVPLLEKTQDGWYRIAADQWVFGKYIQAV